MAMRGTGPVALVAMALLLAMAAGPAPALARTTWPGGPEVVNFTALVEATNITIFGPGYSTCPDLGSQPEGDPIIIDFQYFALQGHPGGTQTVLVASSNQTLAPFSTPTIPIEELFLPAEQPLMNRTCDDSGCIEAYELAAQITDMELGFYDLETGEPLISQFLTYNGQLPGPYIKVDQGVQTLVRLHNWIGCNTSDWTQEQINDTHWADVTGISMHYHGSASLAPFDGWASDFIYRCQWKDYVYPNNKGGTVNWYHDHALNITMFTVSAGLAGMFYTKPCNSRYEPPQLAILGDPEYLVIADQLFIQLPGEEYMSSSLNPGQYIAELPTEYYPGGFPPTFGDHWFVNGKPWPTVTVQRKPYRFVLMGAQVTRLMQIFVNDTATNLTMNEQPGQFWVVGGDGGLRVTPTQAPLGLNLGPGERYQVVLDFSSYEPGSVLYMTNTIDLSLHVEWAPTLCFTNYVMKFVVGDEEPVAPKFDPIYITSIFTNTEINQATLQDACARATAGDVDIAFETGQGTFAPGANSSVRNQWAFNSYNYNSSTEEGYFVSMMGGPGEGDIEMNSGKKKSVRRRRTSARRALKAGGSQWPLDDNTASNITIPTENPNRNPGMIDIDRPYTMPISMPANGWLTMSIYNKGYNGDHPMHFHLIDWFMCSRTNADQRSDGLFDYEIFVPKDIMYLANDDNVTGVMRFGPSQGSYMFHCHNLNHEDKGLMGAFNVTDPDAPGIPNALFLNSTLDPERFAYGFDQVPPEPGIWQGADPLVYDIEDEPNIGHNLYFPLSMPPWAMRQDPDNPGRPQPITEELLQAVLARNYNRNLYPPNRALWQPVNDNPWAVVCPVEEAM